MIVKLLKCIDYPKTTFYFVFVIQSVLWLPKFVKQKKKDWAAARVAEHLAEHHAGVMFSQVPLNSQYKTKTGDIGTLGKDAGRKQEHSTLFTVNIQNGKYPWDWESGISRLKILSQVPISFSIHWAI